MRGRGASGIDTIHAAWINVGPEGAPQRLEGEEMRQWLRNAVDCSTTMKIKNLAVEEKEQH
ncbi:hypothetical protein [Paenibacillus sp. yr247]|uniref:hypothetical protein n=1 Tax=Paenibacillus sp. yr247 TaxID=1761880 RepID=UPI0020C8636F|nr:hypothetical protein [Paenibacillus sp. yr247]